MNQVKCIAVIGGGAAGYFAAIHAAQKYPNASVVLFEKAKKTLSKVKISGGGRCNVTNACFNNRELSKNYPRGEHFLKKCFGQFDAQSTFDWFESRGVQLKTYPDNCVFPVANDSQVIIDCLEGEAKKYGVDIRLSSPILKMLKNDDGSFELNGRSESFRADKVIATVGGQPKRAGLEMFEQLGHTLIEPVPSLFTFNMPGNPITELMGNVVEEVTTKIEGAKLKGQGPLLITHWGMSGPAILQLSAWGARILEEKHYDFAIRVNWLNETTEQVLRQELNRIKGEHSQKKIVNFQPFPMTNRLWAHLLIRAKVSHEARWHDVSDKAMNRLVETLLFDRYEVKGKTTFKEEFVTAGGIPLNEINLKTMESKIVPGLYFAGEMMDIDGITGGFNFQAAWTTGFIAGQLKSA